MSSVDSKEESLSSKFEPTIYFIRGMARKQIIRRTLTLEYNKKKSYYAMRARGNPWYSSRYLRENDYEEELACLRLLGIWSSWVDKREERLTQWFCNLIKRAYPKIYTYVQNREKLNFEKFFEDVVIPNIDYELEIKSVVGVAAVLAILLDKGVEVVESEDKFKNLLHDIVLDIKRYAYPARRLLIEAGKGNDLADKANAIYNSFNFNFNTFGELDRTENSLLDKTTFFTEGITTLSGMSSMTYEDYYFDNRDIMDICKYMALAEIDWGYEPQFMYIGMLVTVMSKKYLELKEYCFKKSGDFEDEGKIKDLKAEISRLKDDVAKAVAEKKLAVENTKNVKNQQTIVDALKVSVADLKEDLSEEREQRKLLEEVIEDMRKHPQQTETVKIPSEGTVVVGGHQNWINKISSKNPAIVFTDGTNAPSVCRNAKTIVFKYDFLSHKVYKPCIAVARKNSIKVVYINGNSNPFG